MKHLFFLLASTCLWQLATAQSGYTGNTLSGFGGAVGQGQLTIADDGTTITIHLIKGTSGSLNDHVVIYVNTKPGGFNTTANFTDVGDDLRKAISGFDGTNRSILTLPFFADYAIAFDQNFGGVWELISNGSHNYIGPANLTPTGTTTAADYQLSFNKSLLGITGNVGFTFLVTYISTTAYRSNEFIGTSGPATNIGWGNYTATSYLAYGSPAALAFTKVSAQAANGSVRLYWEVAGTFENETFTVERSLNGKDFNGIGDLSATSATQYNYEDNNAATGTNYYRIVLNSRTGKKTYSNTVTANFTSKDVLKSYMSNGDLIVQLEGAPKGNYQVAVVNAMGQVVSKNQINYDGTQNIYSIHSASGFTRGIYSVMIGGDNGLSVARQVFIK